MASSSSIANLLSMFKHTKPPQSIPSNKVLPPQRSSSNKVQKVSNSSISIENKPNDVMSVVCPSLAYANTLFFRSAYNVQVIVDDNEPEERLLNRFRREVMRAGVIQESKRRRYFETKQDEKKRKTREAAKRNRRRRPQARNFSSDRPQEISKSKREDEEKDNWDLPQGELPY